MTQAIHIFIEPTEESDLQTMRALKAVGYDVVDDVDVQTFLTKEVLLRQYILRTDVHPFVAGLTFQEAWTNRVETDIKGLIEKYSESKEQTHSACWRINGRN